MHMQVERRTHQALTVPELPGGFPYQTLIDLEVLEYEGGYQVRVCTMFNVFCAQCLMYLKL